MFRMILVGDADDWKIKNRVPDTVYSNEVKLAARDVVHVLDLNLPNMAALAANQIDIRHRIIALPGQAIFMPRVSNERGRASAWEGCYSIPDVICLVERPQAIVVSGINPETGEEMILELLGNKARYALHEIDHLDGVLITDKALASQPKDRPSRFVSQ